MNKSVAEDTIAQLGLTAANKSLANYWLSLWRGDALPERSQFRPDKIRTLLPNLLMFDVIPDKSVTVRLAGTGLRSILGEDITGRDWLELTRVHHRPTRLRNLSAVARGAVMSAHRRVSMIAGHDHINEEIVLPFAREENGQCQIVAHAVWGLDRGTRATDIRNIEDDTSNFRLVPIV